MDSFCSEPRRGNCHILLVGQSVQFVNNLKMEKESEANTPGEDVVILFAWGAQNLDD